MRLVAPLLLAAVFAAGNPFLAASTTQVSRTPPAVYTEHLAAQLTPLAEVLDGRTAFPGEDGGGVVLLFEKIYFQAEDGPTYRLFHIVQYALDQSGVERIANDIYTYDREREDIFLIDAATIRPDGERMPVEANGAFIQTPQHEAENSLYTSEAELNLIFPRVAPGCITESIVLVRENQPVMPGEFAVSNTFSRGWPAHRQRLVLDFPEALLARINAVATGSGVPEPVSERYAPGRERRSWTRAAAPYVRWEENGPQYEYRGPTLWLTTLDSWDTVARWFHGLIADRSTLGTDLAAEVDRWTADTNDRDTIIARLTEKVANDVRYVGLEFGLAGYQPHPCEQVWKTRYGDCKDKANLLRAMLAHKGIAAHVVLLQTSGLGRVQVDSPSWRQFNHAILAIEDGERGFIFCDPTVKYLPGGSVGFSDMAREVLVVQGDRAVWARTSDSQESAIRLQGDLALASDGALSGWFTLRGEGTDAAGYAEYLNGLDRDGRLRWMQQVAEGFFPGAEVVDVDYTPAAGSVTETSVRAYLLRGPRASGDQALVFPYPADWLPSVNTVGERRFPYVTRRREESVAVSIAVPEGWGAPAVPAPFSAPSAVAAFEAAWTATPGKIEARLAWSPKQSALAAADYPVLQRSVRALTAWLEQPVLLQQTSTSLPAAAPERTADLSGFPILPTGQGQLRLLNERYPEDSKPVQRRAALEKVLQWFPNDTETIFEAQVWLASIDWDEKTNQQFADRTADLLQRHGALVGPELRAWAVYLEAKARYGASNDAAAIERLEELAEDKTLSTYRRGWAALFAIRYRRESDPARALEFALRHDEYESEAREAIVGQIAVLLGQTGDAARAATWAGELSQMQAETADPLFAAALDALISGDEHVTEVNRSAIVEAILAAAPAAETHPKTASERARWGQIAQRDQAMRAYRETLHAWLGEHRPAWWSSEKLPQFADSAAVIKHIEACNDAQKGPETVDAAMQLILFHDAQAGSVAMYSRWAMWWLRKKELSLPFLDVIGRAVQDLPPEADAEVIQAWHEYVAYLRANKRLDEARAIYDRVIDHPGAKNYQRVDAGGELGTLELGAGNADAALAAFRRIVPFHTDHKWSVDYLYPAMLIHLGRGEYDEALAMIEAMRGQEQKYIDGSDHKIVVNALLRTAKRPEALRRYWEYTATWLGAWDAVLEANGIERPAPHQLPLETDFEAAAARIEKSVTSRNISVFLRELDVYARVARVVPIFGGDFATQADKATRISPSLAQRVCSAGVGLFEISESVDPEFDASVAVWRAVMLGGAGRRDEAAACGRSIFDELGCEHPQGMAGLRLWVLFTRGTAAAGEAVAALDAALAGAREIPDRGMSARILSDAYWLTKNSAAQRVLLEREMAREGFDRNSEVGKVFVARMDELEKEARNGGALTAALDGWLQKQDTAWLEHVAPRSLGEPRFASLTPPLYTRPEGISAAEALKFNLVAAREEALTADVRAGAFYSAVVDLAWQANDVGRLAEVYLSAAALKVLPDERRARCVYNAANTLIGRGETQLLASVVADPSFQLLAEDRRRSVNAVLKAFTTADAGGEGWESRAWAELSDAPLDGLRVEGARHLIERLAYGGEFARASALVAAAKDVKLDTSTVDKSLAALRLEWTRTIRRVQEQDEFVRGLRAIVRELPGAAGPVPAHIRRQIRFGGSGRLTDDEHLAEAVCLLDHGYLRGDTFPALVLYALHEAQGIRNRMPMLFPRILDLALSVKATDADRALWVSAAAGGSDIDRPEVLERVDRALVAFEKSAAAADCPETAKNTALLRAYWALRVDREPRPPAVFGDLERHGIPEADRRGLELHFLVTRGRTEESVRLAEGLPTGTLMQPQFFRLARNGLVAAGHEVEVELLDEGMRDQLGRAMSDLWMHPDFTYNWAWLHVARALDAEDLVPAAWFERAIAACAGETHRGMLRVHQAHLRNDWRGLREACDAILREVPDMYDVFYDRALARYHLGDKKGARSDLRVMLEHSLNHEDYQHALKLLQELAPGEKPGGTRKDKR